MENNTRYTIILADGTTITATLNGNNYITQQAVDPDLMDEENLYGMTINGVTLYNYVCSNIWTDADGTHMIFTKLKPEELEIAELRAYVEYLMMGGLTE